MSSKRRICRLTFAARGIPNLCAIQAWLMVVVLIIHQYPAVYAPTRFVAGLCQDLKQNFSICIIGEDSFQPVASRHHMVKSSSILDTNLPWHPFPLFENRKSCQDLLTDPFFRPTRQPRKQGRSNTLLLRYSITPRFSAAWMALNNASSLKGFRRKSTAPPVMACVRSSSFARAETKMIGIPRLALVRFRCNSRPSIPGIRRSRIRHLVS